MTLGRAEPSPCESLNIWVYGEGCDVMWNWACGCGEVGPAGFETMNEAMEDAKGHYQ